MICGEIQERLLDRRELRPKEVRHVLACTSCRQLERRLLENRAMLSGLGELGPSRSVLADAVRKRELQRSAPVRLHWAWLALAPAVGAGVLMVGAWHRPHGSSSPRSAGTWTGSAPTPRPTTSGGASRSSGARKRLAHVDRRHSLQRTLALHPQRDAQWPDSASPLKPVAALSPERMVRLIDEADYLDGRRHSPAVWLASNVGEQRALERLLPTLPTPREEFVRIQLPRFAAAGDVAAGKAIKEYEEQAKAVDVRLGRRVTLQMKSVSLEAFAAELTRQSGVQIRISRGLQDEKVTLFLDETPVRDVMREVARLFSYFWSRVGETGSYKYTLEQDLRSQLAEEEMRNRDEHAALLDLDEKMSQFGGLIGLSRQQIAQRAKEARGDEAKRLQAMLDGSWGGIQLYHRLSPAERIALATGQKLVFDQSAADPAQRLPEDVGKGLLQNFWSGVVSFGQHTEKVPTDAPGINQIVQLQVSRSELGQLTLNSNSIISWKGPDGHQAGGVGTMDKLAVGRSPSTANPQNAVNNAALKKDRAFQVEVSVKPEPSCPRLRSNSEHPQVPSQNGATFGVDSEYRRAMAAVRQARGAKEIPHVTSADVWEEVHKKTGLPVVADAYTRLYDQPRLTVEKATLFDALSHLGDELGVRWKKDGRFLLARSTAYFWNKLKEVPNRYLERWRDDARGGGLPLGDLLDMAQLSDRQLASETVGAAVTHCWGVEEWHIVAQSDEPEPLRRWLRYLSANRALAAQAVKPEGLASASLAPQQQAELTALITADGMPLPQGGFTNSTFRVEYVPAGWYVWHRPHTQPQSRFYPLIAERSAQAALKAAQQQDPSVTEAQIARSEGVFAVLVFTPGGWSGLVAGQSPVN